MKQINKLVEPQSLVQHRTNKPAFYENLPLKAKDELRKNLLLEQGHICCYCMKRIPEKIAKDKRISYEMKIEHYHCQDNFETLQLTYTNLFGACTGNEGKPKKLQTCDTRKGNETLTINLLSLTPRCESLFKYNAEGEISSINDDDTINKQLNNVLNLNMQTLKDGRKQIYLEVQKKIEIESKQFGTGQLKLKYFETERQKWIIKNSNKYNPFCMVAIYYLNKKINKLSK